MSFPCLSGAGTIPQESKKEIRIGNIDAIYSAIGRTPGAYFNMINEQGGVNGRGLRHAPDTFCAARHFTSPDRK